MNLFNYLLRFKKHYANLSRDNMPFNPADYKLSWGDMAISEICAYFLQTLITCFDVHTILEFGTGVSTLYLSSLASQIVSYETDSDYLDAFKALSIPHAELNLWDGKHCIDDDRFFDLSFVDGPMFGKNRFYSTQSATTNSQIVVIHDAFRTDDFYNQSKHLLTNPNFKSVILGGAPRITEGHLYFYCYCWTPFEINELPKKLLLSNPVFTPQQLASLHQ